MVQVRFWVLILLTWLFEKWKTIFWSLKLLIKCLKDAIRNDNVNVIELEVGFLISLENLVYFLLQPSVILTWWRKTIFLQLINSRLKEIDVLIIFTDHVGQFLLISCINEHKLCLKLWSCLYYFLNHLLVIVLDPFKSKL